MYAIETENMGAALDFPLSGDFVVTDSTRLQRFFESGLHLTAMKRRYYLGRSSNQNKLEPMKMIIFITPIPFLFFFRLFTTIYRIKILLS